MFRNGSACRRLPRSKPSVTRRRSSAQSRAPRRRRPRRRQPNTGRFPSATCLERLGTLRQQVRQEVKLELRAILDRYPTELDCLQQVLQLHKQHCMARTGTRTCFPTPIGVGGKVRHARPALSVACAGKKGW